MRLQDGKQLGAYVLVSVLAVGTAFALSLKFVGSLRAQEGFPPPAESQAPAEIPAPSDQAPPPVPQDGSAQGVPPQDYPMPGATIPGTIPPDGGQYAIPPSTNSGIAELEGFLEPFIYDVANRRDPFLAFAEFIPAEEGPLRALTPAQRYALEELRLVGVMWEVKDPKAMFMDPDDEVLVLGRDESIGNRNGYIAAIREGEVVVVEAIRKRGDIIYRTRVLRIER